MRAIYCMNAAPDSALRYLSEVSDSMLSLAPEETRMYYGLLTIKAHDKLYHPHTSDSLIRSIVRFYDEYGDLHKRMEAYHYLGSVYRDLGDAPRAIKAYQEVVTLGEHTAEYDLLAKAYGQIGSLLHRQGLEEQAELMGRKELECGMLEGDSAAVGYALRNIARTFRDRNQADSALFLLFRRI